MSVISTDPRFFKPATLEANKVRELAARWLQPALLKLSRGAAALLLPAALLVLALWPVVWLISLPLRVVGLALDSVFALLREFRMPHGGRAEWFLEIRER